LFEASDGVNVASKAFRKFFALSHFLLSLQQITFFLLYVGNVASSNFEMGNTALQLLFGRIKFFAKSLNSFHHECCWRQLRNDYPSACKDYPLHTMTTPTRKTACNDFPVCIVTGLHRRHDHRWNSMCNLVEEGSFSNKKINIFVTVRPREYFDTRRWRCFDIFAYGTYFM